MTERWFRWYDGTVRDGKMILAANICSEPVYLLVAVWASLLEDAATSPERGVAVRGADYHSMFLSLDAKRTQTVWNALERVGTVRIEGERVTILSWNKRQFETDQKDPTASARYEKWRLKNQSLNKNQTEANGSKRFQTPETESETYTETEKKAEPNGSPSDYRSELFGRGLETLARITGKTPNSCRSLVGRLLKTVDDEAIHILAAIEDAERNRVADPVAWIMRALRPHAEKKNGIQTGRELGKQKWRDALDKLRDYTERAGGDPGGTPVRLLPATGNVGPPGDISGGGGRIV